MELYYGKNNIWLDISNKLDNFKVDQTNINIKYHIPKNDIERFNKINIDPLFGVVKDIRVVCDNKTYILDHNTSADIIISLDDSVQPSIKINNLFSNKVNSNIENLRNIQNTLTLKHGSFDDEYFEQLLCTTYLSGNEKVLELGGNIGRVSLIISKQQQYKDGSLVVLESDVNNSNKLTYNMNNNNLTFEIVPAALSNIPLQQKNWVTKPIEDDIILEDYTKVQTINYENFKEKYGVFDVLVVDCEGAFYYIIKNTPEILDNVKTIIIENDYQEKEHGDYVFDVLNKQNFNVVESIPGGFGYFKHRFYEVYQK